MADTLPRLHQVFIDVFEDDRLVVDRGTTAADIPAWDSMMHITLLMATERAFGVRFRARDVVGLASVGELVDLIDRLRAS